MNPRLCASMLFLFLVSSLTLTATGQDAEDEWIDPYDMLNYEPSTKSMRNPVKVGISAITYVTPTKLSFF